MPDLINEWTPVALALRAFTADFMGGVAPATVLAGGATVHGVAMVAGTRLLIFASGNGNGIWELYVSGGGLDLRRTADATSSEDFIAGRQVRVMAGDYAGRVFFYRSFPYIFEVGGPAATSTSATPPAATISDAFTNATPLAAELTPLPPKNNFGSGLAPAALSDAFSNDGPAVVSFNLPYRLTVGGALLTLGDEPLQLRS